jgi:hypothetical protein
MIRRIRRRIEGAERGQSMVEMAMILPLLLLLTLGTLEFGMIFDHHLSLEYATREGARTGSALANADHVAADCATVDAQIVAAVQRVLDSPGSDVDISKVTQIRIYKAQANGNETAGFVNVWTYTPNAGPVVDGSQLDFTGPASPAWPACSRINTQVNPSPDKIGVSITYTYIFKTALGGMLANVTLPMADRTVMTLNPL